MALMMCFSSCLRMSSFIFRRIALQISEYSMLSVGVPFLFNCLRFSLSCLVLVDSLSGFSLLYLPAIEMAASWIIFAVASPLESISSGGIDASNANLFWISTWNSLLWCCNLPVSYLFWLGDHFSSLKLGVNPCFPSYHAMITTRVETVDDWNIKEDVWPIRHDVVNLVLRLLHLGEIHVHRLFSRFYNIIFIVFLMGLLSSVDVTVLLFIYTIIKDTL